MARGLFNLFKAKAKAKTKAELELEPEPEPKPKPKPKPETKKPAPSDILAETVDSLFLSAEIAAKGGEWDRAMQLYRNVLDVKPDHAPAHYKRGNLLKDRQQMEAALASYDEAVALDPGYAHAYCNRGFVLERLGRWDAALESYDRAVALTPGDALAHYNRAAVLRQLARPEEALASYTQAIAVKPDYFEAYCNRGFLLVEMKRWSAAGPSLERAIAIRPDFAEAYASLALTLAAVGHFEPALANFDRAIALKPDYADAYLNRANLLVNMKRFLPAIASYDQGLALNGDSRFVPGMVRYAKMNVCDWSGLPADLQRLASGIEAGEMMSPPLSVLALLDSASLHYKAAQLWAREQHPAGLGALPAISRRPRPDKARIGYFSGDFHQHPVAVLMAGVFEAHDRSKYELIAFSYGPDAQDGMRKRLETAFDRFIDVRGKSDRDIASLAREMNIDVAVDLAGHSGGSRAGIFALRAAPLQVNFLGYPGTVGADYIDYLIGDEIVVPQAHEPHYAEKIVRLPNSFMPHDSTRTIADTVYSREQLGLPPDGFVFCCFNNNYKITPEVFDGWMRILARVPGSVLWLSQNNEPAADNLRMQSVRRGMDAERLIFADRMASPAEHLARHRAADLFLDTRPYNAHATAIDALWAGLPVLTFPGEGFAGRVGASLLKAAQLPELIVTSAESYEDMAVRMAEDPQFRAGIREKLARNRLGSPLFDTRRFTRHLEAGYGKILERFYAGLPPEHILVPP